MARYPDRSLAEDAIFLRSATQKGARLHKVANQNVFVYLRHGSNAWSFVTGHYLDSRAWLPVVEPPLPAEDRAFYAARSAASCASAVATAAVEEPAKTAAMFPPAAQVAAKGTTVVPASSERKPALRPEPVSLPLVSCIMPTYNRRRYVAQAILYFLRQDYPNRELIILDDGDDRVADLAPSDDRIRYIALDRRMILGAKRNLACELAGTAHRALGRRRLDRAAAPLLPMRSAAIRCRRPVRRGPAALLRPGERPRVALRIPTGATALARGQHTLVSKILLGAQPLCGNPGGRRHALRLEPPGAQHGPDSRQRFLRGPDPRGQHQPEVAQRDLLAPATRRRDPSPPRR